MVPSLPAVAKPGDRADIPHASSRHTESSIDFLLRFVLMCTEGIREVPVAAWRRRFQSGTPLSFFGFESYELEAGVRHFLVELTVTGTIAEPALIAQREFLQKMTEEGRLVLAGSLPDKPGRGAAILRADSLEEARAIYSEAPFVKAGLIDWVLAEIKVTYGIAAQ